MDANRIVQIVNTLVTLFRQGSKLGLVLLERCQLWLFQPIWLLWRLLTFLSFWLLADRLSIGSSVLAHNDLLLWLQHIMFHFWRPFSLALLHLMLVDDRFVLRDQIVGFVELLLKLEL